MLGKTISHYKIIEKLGQGGMGEVYLAEDSRLDRKVALKILPQHLSDKAELRERFEREARAVSSLNHPHICTLYDIGEQDGIHYLVMEHLVGETLEARLEKGPLPLEQTLEYAIQIADALEAAHKQNIVHRDLKPSNIMLISEGHVKVMDFGLAKRVTPVEGQEQEITTALTQQGSTLGTVPYMSPEQVRGQEVDTRSDIFSFGVVVYEMLSGLNPFKKGSVMDTATAILSETPAPLTRYTEDIPVLLQHAVKKMLAKKPDRRYQLVHDVRTDLEDVRNEIERALVEPTAAPPTSQAPRRLQPWTMAVGLGVLTAIVTSLVVWSLIRSSPPVPQAPTQFVITPPPSVFLANNPPDNELAVSPDGRRIVYLTYSGAGTTQLYVRSLDELMSTPIRGTENADGDPFFSPDGEWLAFFTLDSKLKKVSLMGGTPITLCNTPGGNRFGSWAEDTIIFSSASAEFPLGLYRVSAAGGEPEILALPDAEKGELQYFAPEILPGSKTVLFTILKGPSNVQVAALSLETKEQKIVLEGGRVPRYAPTGHLVYGLPATGTLMAVPFDLARLEITGSPVPILEGVRQGQRAVDYAISDNGTLIYVPSTSTGGLNRTLVWVDRKGQEELLAAEPHGYESPRISPNGSRLAITINESGGSDVWIYDLEREILTRLTFNPAGAHFPVWTPDGQRIVFDSGRAGGLHNLFWKAADGTGQVERLTTSPNNQMADSFSPDGKRLVFREAVAPRVLQALSMEGERTSQILFQSQFNQTHGTISPDGHWIAYESDESGRYEIYVRPFPKVEEGKWQISNDGGVESVWGPRGQELFYRNGEAMIAVGIKTEPTFTAGSPVVLFTGRYTSGIVVDYDISPNGQRFLMIKAVEGSGQINVVLNWFEELKRLVPTP